jgi:hypothetical protein
MTMYRCTIEVEWVDDERRGWAIRVMGADGTVQDTWSRETLPEAIDLAGACLRGQLEWQVEQRAR